MVDQQRHNYKIISPLGEGGMANVYLAQHQSLGNNVAIKLLKEEFVQHPNIRKRFLAEA
jgi:serine/threonine protein kinase